MYTFVLANMSISANLAYGFDKFVYIFPDIKENSLK